MKPTARQTTKLSLPGCCFVAHRGLSGIETENTCAAFLLAATRGYWGVETDVHLSSDGKFVISHDASLSRVSGVDFDVRRHSAGASRRIPLHVTAPAGEKGFAQASRSDLRVPLFEDYLSICAKYGKYPVIEIKDAFSRKTAERFVGIVADFGLRDDAVYIAFDWNNCLTIRSLLPDAPVMNLNGFSEVATREAHLANRIGADFEFQKLDEETVSFFLEADLPVCAWTVDSPEVAVQLAERGVQYITTNILEPADDDE